MTKTSKYLFLKWAGQKNNYKKIFLLLRNIIKDALKFELNDKFVSLNKYFNIT